MIQQPYEKAISDAQKALFEAKRLILSDLKNYPTPISGCDQQYIRLLADRTRISRAIQSLDDLPFVATPRVLEDGAISEIR